LLREATTLEVAPKARTRRVSRPMDLATSTQ
jgi:hypothetical protein